ncbi:hypothetical protein, partial [Salmonella enterica]|uniref:hypothetical protein n=1 Tax=Salmonella enterica TaxID=28901 RepID=UPI00398C322D
LPTSRVTLARVERPHSHDTTGPKPVFLVPPFAGIAGTDLGERLLPDGAPLISPTQVVWAHRLI